MESERQEHEGQRTGSRRGASTTGIAAAMVRPDGDGLAHWGGKRPPRTARVDVAGGTLPEKDR